MTNFPTEDDLATRVTQTQAKLQDALAALQTHEQELAVLQAEQERLEAERQTAIRREHEAELARLQEANLALDVEFCDQARRLVEVAVKLQTSALAVDRFVREHSLPLNKPLLKPFPVDQRYLLNPELLAKVIGERRRRS